MPLQTALALWRWRVAGLLARPALLMELASSPARSRRLGLLLQVGRAGGICFVRVSAWAPVRFGAGTDGPATWTRFKGPPTTRLLVLPVKTPGVLERTSRTPLRHEGDSISCKSEIGDARFKPISRATLGTSVGRQEDHSTLLLILPLCGLVHAPFTLP